MRKIITINRQFSSGGREIGKRLSEVLGIDYFDRELIDLIAKETNLHPDFISTHQESYLSMRFSFTYGRTFSISAPPITEQLQITQTNIIKDLAKSNDCIIVGRCASHILENEALKVLIYSSDMEQRIDRCYDKVPEDRLKSREEMRKDILAVDKNRGKYHLYYTGKKWLDIENYNVCIDTSKISVEQAVSMLAGLFK